MIDEKAATDPAVMPSEEEIARAIATFRKHLYPDSKIDILPSEMAQASAVLALFAPILAEKDVAKQHRDSAIRYASECSYRASEFEARALAAEAALAAATKPDVEIRRNDDCSIDEFVAKGVSIHLEQMDTNSWYLGLDAPGKSGSSG